MGDTSSERRKRRRHRLAVIVGLVTLFAAFIGVEIYIQRAPTALAPVSNTVLLHAITVLNLILLLVLLFVLGRNLVKLYVERRRNALGSKFRTKLVVTYIGLALVPSIFLFLVASDLIQKSIDRWFSTDVEEVTTRSRELVHRTLLLQEDELQHLAESVARQITDGRMLTVDSWQYLRTRMRERLDELQLDLVYVFAGDHLLIDPVVAADRGLAAHLPGTASLASLQPPPPPPTADDGAASVAGGGTASVDGDDAAAGDGEPLPATGPAPVAQLVAAGDAEAPGTTSATLTDGGDAEAPDTTSATPADGGDALLAVPGSQIRLALAGQPFRLQDELPDDRVVVRAGAPVLAPNGRDVAGVLVVGRILDADLTRQADAIETLYRSHMQGAAQKEPIKTNYLLTFLLLTLLILFSMVWAGLYLAKGVTVPIQKLAEGTRAVAAGNLDYRVEVEARDELGTLVASFNRMTDDLRASQDDLEKSRDRLEQTITELEERRSYMESVLANIATGVISMNAEGRITTFNPAARRMLGIPSEGDVVGRHYATVLGSDSLRPLRDLLECGGRGRSAVEEEVVVEAGGRRLTLAAHSSSLLDSGDAYLGTVVVLDDLTELIKAQKAAAWREVARRIAHEIRNPLTPIQLSAQRIARRYRRAAGAETEYTVIEEGTQTILQEVATLKGLVEEFSRFARMPSARPEPTDINELLDSSLLPYGSTHEGIDIDQDLDPRVPTLEVDPDHLRRAFTNLFDNAVEAMDGRGELRVSTRYDPDLEVVRIEVADSGPGILPEDKDRLFLPYFSRKRDGTGLGLAIVHQIVSDHRGYVRVADNLPRGTVFVVELPRV